MKILIISLVLFLMCLGVLAQTITELPEPILIEWQFKCQILWGSIFSDSKWVDQPITYNIISGTVDKQHDYHGKPGIQTWETTIPDNDLLNPKKVIIQFPINNTPIGINVNFYRSRLIAYRDMLPGDISNDDPHWAISYWVVIYGTGKPGTTNKIK